MDRGADDFLALLPHPLAPVILVTQPQSGSVSGFCYGTSVSGEEPIPDDIICRDFPLRLPYSQYSSPVILALTTRAIYDFLHDPERGAVAFRRVNEALANGPWRREGIYVFPKERVTDEEWSRGFERFLKAGFLIPPTTQDPLVLPGELSPGEEKALAGCLREGL
jgi:hypothetical protein